MKLDLNVSKTKMLINFSKKALALQARYGTQVKAGEYKYLEKIFDNMLKLDPDTDLKKSHQRLFVLRKLCIYNSLVESVLFCLFLICWFSSLSMKNKNRLQSWSLN